MLSHGRLAKKKADSRLWEFRNLGMNRAKKVCISVHCPQFLLSISPSNSTVGGPHSSSREPKELRPLRPPTTAQTIPKEKCASARDLKLGLSLLGSSSRPGAQDPFFYFVDINSPP